LGSLKGVRSTGPGFSDRVRIIADAGPSMLATSTTHRTPVSPANDCRA
jgi:hypothetical protein